MNGSRPPAGRPIARSPHYDSFLHPAAAFIDTKNVTALDTPVQFVKGVGPRVLDFDAGNTDGADIDGQGQPLKERKVHMDIEALRPPRRTKRSVTIWNFLRAASRWLSPFFRPKSCRLLQTSSLRR